MPVLPLRSTPKPPPAPRPEISSPMDGRKLAPGPNQLAGLLGKVPDKTKGQVLDLQNRPAAFYQGSQATRQLAGRDVSISAPFLGAPIPKGNEYAMPGKSGGASAKGGSAQAKGGTASAKSGTPAAPKEGAASKPGQQDLSSLEGPPTTQALVRRESGDSSQRIIEIPDFPAPTSPGLPRRGSFDLSSASGGHNPQALAMRETKPSVADDSMALVKYEKKEPGSQGSPMDLSSAAGGHDPSLPVRKQSEDSPQRMTSIPEHIPTPQNAVAKIEPKPAGRPDTESPDAPASRPSLHRQDSRPHVDPGLENLHLSQPGDHFNPPPAYSQKPPPGHKTTETGPGAHEELPVEDEKKKMSLGKKVMMGVGGAAALLGITFLMSTPTPPPPPEKST